MSPRTQEKRLAALEETTYPHGVSPQRVQAFLARMYQIDARGHPEAEVQAFCAGLTPHEAGAILEAMKELDTEESEG